MGSRAETGARDGTPDTFGIVDVNAGVSAGEAAFTGGAGAATLNMDVRTMKWFADSAKR
jgi:hypothetical protein